MVENGGTMPLKHVSNRPQSELLIWEKNFIYKNKVVAINFDIPQFSDLFKLMGADYSRQRSHPHSLQATDDGVNTAPKAQLLK